MNRERTKEFINEQEPDFLQRAAKKGYICPNCGQGSTKGIGISKDQKTGRYHCFDCGLHADILELYGIANGIRDFPDQLRGAADHYGIRLEDDPHQISRSENAKPRPADHQAQDQKDEEPATDYTEFFLKANRALDQTDYHRGISRKTLDFFIVGYDPAWKNPKAPKMEPSPRLIIPTSQESYLARYAGEGDFTNYQGKTENKSKVGAVHIFNEFPLRQSERPVFIVEGEVDAMSIIDAGGEAVGLGSKSNAKKFLKIISGLSDRPPFIVVPDNDESGGGQKAAAELTANLKELGAAAILYNLAGKYHDANDRLMHDRAGLTAEIPTAEEQAELAKESKAKEYREKNAASSYLQEFLNGIAESASTPAAPTGFPALDRALDGGLYAGLYTIGAISSLGKTTLVLQIADNIARSGKDVLIVSMEMARSELMAKSISRHTLEILLEEGAPNTANAKTTRGIMDGKRYAMYSQEERQLIQRATKAYGSYADHVFILEGIGNLGAPEIRQAVAEHREATGETPIIVVDYLQILAPADPRSSDKTNTDRAVLELKRISRDFKTPIIAISALNRDNYNARVNMSAFKESGAIEYSADCLIGLQYAGAGTSNFDAEEAATQTPRQIEAVILKHRNGRKGDIIPLAYYPMFNYFREDENAGDPQQKRGRR